MNASLPTTVAAAMDGHSADDRRAAEAFLDAYRLVVREGTLAGLGEAAEAFSGLPYENISKLLKTVQGEGPDDWRRMPLEVVEDHLRHGLGGACFSLTHSFRRVAERLGFEARPVIAETPAGPARHCALVVRQGADDWLVDPGYLICEPVRLDGGRRKIATPRGALLLDPDRRDGRYVLYDEAKGPEAWRWRLDPRPVDDTAFIRFWNASFFWPSMRQLVATRRTEAGQLYLHNRHLRTIRAGETEKRTLGHDLEATVAALFGIEAAKVAQARALVNARRAKRKI